MIPDEPVRGHTAPAWVYGLDGLERIRLYSQGKLPTTPFSRLLGTRVTNVVPGSVMMTQPAAPALAVQADSLEATPLTANALFGACSTAAQPGSRLRVVSFTQALFRPLRSQPGNLLARAHIINSSRYTVSAEAFMEDPEGRSIAHGTMHAAFERVDPPPPQPPRTIPRVEEPVYETPDPYLRSYPAGFLQLPWNKRDGIDVYREAMERGIPSPMRTLLGLTTSGLEPGRLTVAIPASQWFCNAEPSVSEMIIATLASMGMYGAAQTLQRAGVHLAVIERNVRFFRMVPPDGRQLRCDARSQERDDGLVVAESTIADADGEIVADSRGTLMRVAASDAAMGRRKTTERMLVTLLFTDIAGSTEQVRSTGDAAWSSLLEEHYLSVRREISRYNGTEVDTAGDGFFARFDSPMRAIGAARAVRAAAARQRLQIRAGIHTGECEIQGNKLAGIAVHLASRIQSAAEPGEILVSSTVKDLVDGADVRLADRGEHDLKGIPDRRRLFAVLEG